MIRFLAISVFFPQLIAQPQIYFNLTLNLRPHYTLSEIEDWSDIISNKNKWKLASAVIEYQLLQLHNWYGARLRLHLLWQIFSGSLLLFSTLRSYARKFVLIPIVLITVKWTYLPLIQLLAMHGFGECFIICLHIRYFMRSNSVANETNHRFRFLPKW